ncbi:hypothetical protein OIDMADRAFT_184319 [Oidiodendron maius Zn]|uniref:Uncharacterized protein n=1 Tax=Oidiodendron maius (strain Zn) TaxID=913774 RepID=A0A0C3GTU4_OIDMZ|nr:hypothetical protein OIDMADRAFT_184319 [Oidiodendron maius Zn]
MARLDIEAFAAAWTALYKQLDAIGYLLPDSVVYPPHNPALPLPRPPPPDMPLHPWVLDLLPRLPYPPDWDCAGAFELLPRTQAISYIDDRTLHRARDPEHFYLSEPPRVGANGVVGGILDEAEIVLTTQSPDGMTLILDVVNGTIREYSASDGPPGPASELAVPDDPCHPHNWPALPAVETVWSYVDKFASLEWIAFRPDSELGIIESYYDEHAELRRILIETYGWPNAFRKEDWINEKDDLVAGLRDQIPWLKGDAPIPLEYL